MTQLPPDDQQWQEFLRKHRPTPPPAADGLEDQLMKAIAQQTGDRQANLLTTAQKPAIVKYHKIRQMWTARSAIAAGLLMAMSGYHILMLSTDTASSASLDAFMENNWNEVVGDRPASSHNTTPLDWMLEVNTSQGAVTSPVKN